MSDWRDELLQGIDHVPRTRLHGSLVVFGDKAIPVLHGENPQDIPLAAAEIGKGRVCVATSKFWMTGDMSGTKVIQQNLRTWVSRGRYQNEETDIMVISKNRDRIPPGVKIIMFTGGKIIRRMERDFAEFVEKGGGLLYADPNGMKEISAGKPHDVIPLSSILLKAGIAYTGKVIRSNKVGYSVQAPDGEHNTLYQYRESMEHIDQLAFHGVSLASSLSKLPKDVLVKEFSDHLIALQDKYVSEFEEAIADSKKGTKRQHQIGILHLVNIMANNKIHYDKSPGASHFPGDFPSPPDLQCGEINIRGQYKEMYPTGFYLPAGQELSLQVTTEDDTYTKWAVQIGAHKDKLHKKDKLSRLPEVAVLTPITEREMKIYSAHGGLVYFQSSMAPSRLEVRIENVVAAPYYNKTSVRAKRQWLESREGLGLWADIAGEYIVLTVPSSVVRDLDDPREMIDYWDQAVFHEHDLRGTNPSRHKRQWIVADQQPAAGAMHSGYPIVTHLNIADERHNNFVFNMPRLREHGSWGIFHEIGHNMQRNAWTFEGTREVTNNIFTLYTCEMMSKAKVWINPWVEKQLGKAKEYLSSGSDFGQWKKNPGVALVIFVQLAHHFGWQSFKRFFREYELIPLSEHPKANEDKIEQWIGRFSAIVGFNLCPLFDFWGFEITEDVNVQLQELPLCLPDDEITQLAPHRYRRMVEKYGSRVVTEIAGFDAPESVSSHSPKGQGITLTFGKQNKSKKAMEGKLKSNSSSGASADSVSEDEVQEESSDDFGDECGSNVDDTCPI